MYYKCNKWKKFQIFCSRYCSKKLAMREATVCQIYTQLAFNRLTFSLIGCRGEASQSCKLFACKPRYGKFWSPRRHFMIGKSRSSPFLYPVSQPKVEHIACNSFENMSSYINIYFVGSKIWLQYTNVTSFKFKQ